MVPTLGVSVDMARWIDRFDMFSEHETNLPRPDPEGLREFSGALHHHTCLIRRVICPATENEAANRPTGLRSANASPRSPINDEGPLLAGLIQQRPWAAARGRCSCLGDQR